MGFGLISLGWLFFADIPWKVDLLADFIGCFLVVAGCNRLRPYSVHFGNAANWFRILTLPSVVITGMEIAYAFGAPKVISDYILHLEVVHTLVFAVALYYLLLAIIAIATDVGREKIARKCRRNMSIDLVTVLFYLATRLLANLQVDNNTVMRLLSISWLVGNVLWYLLLVLQFVQIFSCYMWICYEGDEDMPMKQSSLKTNPYARFEKKKADRMAASDEQVEPKKKKKKKK